MGPILPEDNRMVVHDADITRRLSLGKTQTDLDQGRAQIYQILGVINSIELPNGDRLETAANVESRIVALSRYQYESGVVWLPTEIEDRELASFDE